MAKQNQNFVFKDEYQKAAFISIRNKTLGRHFRLTKEQILAMAKAGTLGENQIKSLFKAQETESEPKTKKDKSPE